MSILKYQKSTLKILDFLLRKADKEFIIEELIKSRGIGRTAGFQSLKELEGDSFIRIREEGRQKMIRLIPSKKNLSMKFFFDNFLFQALPKEIKMAINAFVQEIGQPVCLVLFGGILSKVREESDIDILAVGQDESAKKELWEIRERAELITGRTINLHFTKKPEVELLLKGICLNGRDLYLNILEEELNKNQLRAANKFKEAIKWNKALFDSLNKKEFGESLEKVITELSFFYAFSLDKFELSREEARELFFSKHGKELTKLKRTKDNFKKFKIVDRIIAKLGEKIA